MAFEKSWTTVLPTPLTADGTSLGVIKVADTIGFQVKGIAQLTNNAGLTMIVQVNQVLNSTTIIVGKPGSSPSATEGGLASGAVVDVSAFTVATASTIGFGMQPKSKIKPDDIEQATYQNDPTVAVRVIPVDPYGALIGQDNPLPVAFDGTVSIGDVHILGPAPDNNELNVNTDGSINVNIVSTPTTGNNVVNIYGEANSVASGATTTVVQYTLSLAKTSGILYRISVSGENIAKWTVFINGTQIDTRRTYYGSSLSEYFEFITGTSDGVALSPGDQVTLKVLHNRPYVGDFEGRIQVLEIS